MSSTDEQIRRCAERLGAPDGENGLSAIVVEAIIRETLADVLADAERWRRTPVTAGYTVEDYRNAPSGIGPLAAEWANKPHRLVYDLAQRVAELDAARGGAQ